MELMCLNGGLPFGEKLGEPSCFQGKSWVMIEAAGAF